MPDLDQHIVTCFIDLSKELSELRFYNKAGSVRTKDIGIFLEVATYKAFKI